MNVCCFVPCLSHKLQQDLDADENHQHNKSYIELRLVVLLLSAVLPEQLFVRLHFFFRSHMVYITFRWSIQVQYYWVYQRGPPVEGKAAVALTLVVIFVEITRI